MDQFDQDFAKYDSPQHSKCADKEAYVSGMFDSIASSYDLANKIMSGGLDILWRRRMIREAELKLGGELLDECTGTGDVMFEFAHAVPGCKGVGLDFSAGMLEVAIKKNTNPNFSFVQASVLGLPFESERFDVVTMSYGLRSITDIPLCFREQARVLKSGGRALCLELSRPTRWWARLVYWPVLNIYLPVVGRLISGHNSGYKYLSETIQGFFEPEQISDFMSQAGLKNCRRIELMLGAATLYIGDKP